MIRTLAQSVLLLCLSSGSAMADWETVNRLRAAGDWEAAFRELEPLAEAGDARAQLELGEAYFRGDGTERNVDLAVVWVRRAAEQGDALAQLKYGLALREGLGGTEDQNAATEWFRRSAEQGNATAQLVMGRSHIRGTGGLAIDPTEGARYLELAAQQGQADAQLELGQMYMAGRGVPKNEKKGADWIEKAAFQRNPKAYFPYAEIFRKGTGRRAYDRIALSWMEMAADAGDSRAMRHLGLMNLEGTRMLYSAPYWFKRAIEAGNWKAAYNLAEMHDKGVEVNQDFSEAARYYQIAADNGDERAIARLSELREQGLIPN